MESYFSKAMELNDRYNPISALASNSIHPDNSKAYNAEDIKKALESAFGATVII